MSRPLAIKQKQVTAICKGAQKAGHVPVLEIDGVRVLLVPANHDILRTAEPPRIDDKGKGYL